MERNSIQVSSQAVVEPKLGGCRHEGDFPKILSLDSHLPFIIAVGGRGENN